MMSRRTRTIVNAAKLAVAATVTCVLLIVIINAITNPIDGPTTSYTADFTDVSGLHVNGDIRFKGTLVGKVDSIDIVRDQGLSAARVQMSLHDSYSLTEATTLAIKYQNLTGVRYVDLSAPVGDRTAFVSHIPVDKTKPSFDITELFNGLEPVLRTMSTDEVNQFADNAITFLEGDGRGLAPMLDSVQRLSEFATDRQTLISTLAANLSRVAEGFGGDSEEAITFLQYANYSVGQTMSVIDLFEGTAVLGPQFTGPIHRILVALGISRDFDLDEFIRSHIPDITTAIESLRMVPGALAALNAPAVQNESGALSCSNGPVNLPSDVTVFLGGSGVIVCNPR